MRIIETKAYKFEELSKEAKQKAIEKYREKYAYDLPWCESIIDSLLTLYKTAGVNVKDYQLGMDRSYVKIDLGDANELKGTRALAWLENNLLDKLRIKYRAPDRWKLSKYGSDYRAGKIKPCPFTGYCSDDDYLDHLIKDVRAGHDLIDCFRWLADYCQELITEEYEDQNSEESIKETFEANEWEFTESGNFI
jgi:hypothetical protein